MNRVLLMIVAALGTSSLLLVDSAVKGTALLTLAAVAAALLRRDSAATRHLVWLVAVVALLVVPVLSATLPRWRVLPAWAGVSPRALAVDESPAASPAGAAAVVGGADEPSRRPELVEAGPAAFARPPVAASGIAAEGMTARPAPATPQASPTPPARGRNWVGLLPFAWAIGFCILALRLLAARWVLWNAERSATPVSKCLSIPPGRVLQTRVSSSDSWATEDPLITALEAARSQLSITRPVTLLIHPDEVIPVVWGILRPRLLLPTSARHWDAEQLRSVLLHELAHIRRHDAIAQLLTQVACALHWFNPLAWLAAWRLGVERERACDDLVLASGVRPSAYAGHLLGVVAGLTSGPAPARWAPSCGLAMAGKSPLEGRLAAVLGKNLNRRGASAALAAVAFAIAVSLAVPIAMLRAAGEKPSAKPGEQPGEKPAAAATHMKPLHEYAQSLFAKWKADARTDGKIPGALIGQLAGEVDNFIKQYPKDEKSPKLAALRPRLDASHDWAPADVVALLDDITAISTAPVSWTDLPMQFSDMGNIKPGQPLPDDLKAADWGTPAPTGLRAAWLLEPRAEQYPLGTVLKARVLFHNTGKEPVVFKTETWHQEDPHTAKDARGAKINVTGTFFTGITPTAVYRLAPGEYCEVTGHGLAIGAGKYEEETSTGAIGAVIEAKEGDEVHLSHGVEATRSTWSRPGDPKDPTELWKKNIAERVEREAPLPKAPADREQLVRRVTLDLFGIPATPEEIAAFVGDDAPDALAKLTTRLQAKPHAKPWSGNLPTGETVFRVTAADPNAAKAPRTAKSPGRYVLGDNVHLLVSQTTTEARRANKAVIAFLSPDPKVESPHKPYEIELPDGIGTYGIAWERGAGVLWVTQKGLIRKYDFTNPDQVKETPFKPGTIDDVPEQLRGAMRSALQAPDAPVQQQESQKQREGARGEKGANGANGAKLDPDTEKKLQWSEAANGLRAAVVIRTPPDKAGELPDLYLALQNVSNAPVRLSDADVPPKQSLRVLYLKVDGKIMMGMGSREPALGDLVLQPREVTFLPLFDPDTKLDVPADPTLNKHTIGSHLAEGALKETNQTFFAELTIEKAPAGAWTGKLRTAEVSGAAAAGKPEPKDKRARALFNEWQRSARSNGDLPAGLVSQLADQVKLFIHNNTGDASGDPYAKKMAPLLPRLDASHDWKPADAAALMDDIAAVTPIPLEVMLEDMTLDHAVQKGAPLPANLANAPWGEPQPNGLRLAWLLEPRAAEYRLNTPLKSRVLIHNSGKEPVLFRAPTFHQGGHTARDATGAEIKVESTEWLTLSRLMTYRLAPGEFVEVNAPGIGVGAMKGWDDWEQTRVGSWIEAKAGDDVTLTTGAVPLGEGNETPPPPGAPPAWWPQFIEHRLAREAPLPATADERTRLLGRVTHDLFGNAPTAAETAAFVADHGPDPLGGLAKRLAARPGFAPTSGELTSAPTKFHVLPADPDAAKKPRTASNPGQYTLRDNVTLEVTRRPDGERIVNEAHIAFSPPDPGKPIQRHEVKLPDGYGTWAAAWVRGGPVLWVQDKTGIRRYDLTNPADVKETTLATPADFEKVPKPVRDALRGVFDASGEPRPATEAPK